jgi:zinc protease
VEIFRLPTNYFDTYRDRVKAVTAQDVLRVAQTHLDPSRLQVIVVGDATAIRPTVEALSLGAVTVYDPAADDVAAAPVSPSSAS